MSADQAARLRAAEIVAAGNRRITLREAYEMVYEERYNGDFKAILRELAQQAAGSSTALARSTYVLPDDENEQLALLEIPAVIAVPTPDGPLFVPHDEATVSDVELWLDEGDRYHSTQKYRFRKGRKELKELIHDDDDRHQLWKQLRPVLAERKQAAIEGTP